ncbi:MAG: hypothetical protein NT077_04185 [Candidatus Taylorbacteria bacterium]|nr:hypothetical protein [Candidatus Taylorbacteria bacterium]
MLSLFPTFLSWNQLSPFLIRVVLGAIFIFWSYRGLRNSRADVKARTTSVIEGIAGILLVIGLWTQLATIVIGIDLIIRLVDKVIKKSFLTDGVNYYLVLLVLAVSLLVTGAGFWAFDLSI